MGAMQAQDWGQAKWAVGLRAGVSAAEVDAAVERGEVVRTWPMRGTLHLVPARDVLWMLELMTPRIMAGAAQRLKALELDEADVSLSTEVMARALEGGNVLTREEVLAAVERGGLATTAQRGYHLLWRAAQAGVIACGPVRGKSQTFVLLREWAPEQWRPTREEALAEIARRYFRSHGLATLQDFGWWTGLTMRDVRAAVDGAKGEMEKTSIGGTEYWSGGGGESARTIEGKRVYLLPGFDEYLLGYEDRSAVLDATHAGKVVPGANGVFKPIVVADGKVVGTWKRTVKAKHVVVEAEAFESWDDGVAEGIRAGAGEYARFLELDLKLG